MAQPRSFWRLVLLCVTPIFSQMQRNSWREKFSMSINSNYKNELEKLFLELAPGFKIFSKSCARIPVAYSCSTKSSTRAAVSKLYWLAPTNGLCEYPICKHLFPSN